MKLKGDPCSIKFKKGLTYTPFKVLNARPIPLHMRSKADKLVEELIEKEVIAKSPPTSPLTTFSKAPSSSSRGPGIRRTATSGW